MTQPPRPSLSATLTALERDLTLRQPEALLARAEAIDFIEFHLLEDEASPDRDRALALHTALRDIERQHIAQLRDAIRSSSISAEALRRLILAHQRPSRTSPGAFDHSDVFVNRLLGLEDAALEPRVELTSEMVFFQATPVRDIVELIDAARLSRDDLFVDLGAGLGRVPMLVSLLTGARCLGIELEPSYCEYATARAAELNLSGTTFRNEDARAADLSRGSVFFMYHPFTGQLLEDVLERLRAQTAGRRIRLCTLGRCTATVAAQTWLERVSPGAYDEHQLTLFASR